MKAVPRRGRTEARVGLEAATLKEREGEDSVSNARLIEGSKIERLSPVFLDCSRRKGDLSKAPDALLDVVDRIVYALVVDKRSSSRHWRQTKKFVDLEYRRLENFEEKMGEE